MGTIGFGSQRHLPEQITACPALNILSMEAQPLGQRYLLSARYMARSTVSRAMLTELLPLNPLAKRPSAHPPRTPRAASFCSYRIAHERLPGSAGSLYDLLAAPAPAASPAGQTNVTRAKETVGFESRTRHQFGTPHGTAGIFRE